MQRKTWSALGPLERRCRCHRRRFRAEELCPSRHSLRLRELYKPCQRALQADAEPSPMPTRPSKPLSPLPPPLRPERQRQAHTTHCVRLRCRQADGRGAHSAGRGAERRASEMAKWRTQQSRVLQRLGVEEAGEGRAAPHERADAVSLDEAQSCAYVARLGASSRGPHSLAQLRPPGRQRLPPHLVLAALGVERAKLSPARVAAAFLVLLPRDKGVGLERRGEVRRGGSREVRGG